MRFMTSMCNPGLLGNVAMHSDMIAGYDMVCSKPVMFLSCSTRVKIGMAEGFWFI